MELSVNVDVLDAATKKAVAADLKADPKSRSGTDVSHPFYLIDMKQRMNIIAYLRSLDDKSK